MDALERTTIGARHSGPVSGIVGPFLPDWRTARSAPPYHRGDVHMIDGTLTTDLLVRAYRTERDNCRRDSGSIAAMAGAR
jgi:hypothetical protein